MFSPPPGSPAVGCAASALCSHRRPPCGLLFPSWKAVLLASSSLLCFGATTLRGSEEKPGQRLSVLTQGEPIQSLPGYPDITTVHEMMQFSFAKYAKCVARAHPSARARMRGEPTCANRPEPPFLPNPTSVRAR